MAVAVFVAVAALAVAATVLAVSVPPFYWPTGHLSVQLAHQPALHSVLVDIRLSLVRLAGHFGF